MPRTAKCLMTNRSQGARLPKEYQFDTDEVLIRHVGDDVLSPRPRDWRTYFEWATVASDAFMADVEDPPFQERETNTAAEFERVRNLAIENCQTISPRREK